MSPPAKILIIRLSSLGDILHALPAFQSLRESFPAARIDWLVDRKAAFLPSSVAGVDNVFVIDTKSLRNGRLKPWREAAKLLGTLRGVGYDISLDFQGLLKTAVLSVLCGARERLGFDRGLVRERPSHWFYTRRLDYRGPTAHVVTLNQMLAEAAGAAKSQARVRFAPEDTIACRIKEMLRIQQLSDFVVINPGGGWITKRWSPSRYGALAARIQNELGLPVVVTIGPGEEGLYEEIALNAPGPVPRRFQVSFMELIPLLRRARLLVGGDTGPFHLACALGTPVVGILGPTAPARNGPWSASDESVFRVLPCSFCNGRTCPTNNECMDLEVEQVFDSVVRRLAQKR
jgi:lipopolysaccharide heptosyltransferase I